MYLANLLYSAAFSGKKIGFETENEKFQRIQQTEDSIGKNIERERKGL